jgi:outer membrane immunogenic protein
MQLQGIVGAALVLLGTVGVGRVSAADLPAPYATKAPPAPGAIDWTGFYAGIEGGGAWGSHSFLHPGGVDTGSKLQGGLIGGDVGYDFQSGAWVFGAEADLSWADISGSAPCRNPIFTCSAKVDWLGTARARVGSAYDRFLPYVTGGLAYGNVQRLGSGFGTALTQDSVHTGWTAGAGVEYALDPNWSLRGEYLYVDLGSRSYPRATVGPVTYGLVSIDPRFSIVRFGVDYKFH